MTVPFLLQVKKMGNQYIFDVDGPVDQYASSHLKERIAYIRNTTDDYVIINFENVKFLDYDSFKRAMADFSPKYISLVNFENLLLDSEAERFFKKFC